MTAIGLTAGAIVGTVGSAVVLLTATTVVVGVDMLTGGGMIVVLAVAIPLGASVPVSYDIVLWAAAIIGMPADTLLCIATGININMLADTNANMWAARITILEFKSIIVT